MRSLLTSKYFLISSLLVIITGLYDLYPQKSRPSNPPDRQQINRPDHEKGNDRERIRNEEKKDENTGERKEHTGINIKRPDRTDSVPKNPQQKNRVGNDKQIIEDNTVCVDIDIEYIPVPAPIPFPPKIPVRPGTKPHYNPPVYDPFNSGLQKLEEMDYEGALHDFNTAIKKDPGNYRIYYYRGLALLNLHFYNESIEDFDYFLTFYFYDMDGYFQRGLAKFYLMQKLGAHADFSIAAEMGHKIAASIIKRFY